MTTKDPLTISTDNRRRTYDRKFRARRTAAILVAAGLSATSLTACVRSGPSTEQQLCSSYRQLSTDMVSSHFSDNIVFDDAGSLAGLASRFPGNATVSSSASTLQSIANSSSTSIGDLMQAAAPIAAICDQSTGLG
jgi:hypothetical protein